MYNADRVRETTTSTGTGTVTLAGAVAQHQTFTSRVKTGDQCEYCILDANGTGWEVGIGTMATTSTLSRDTILQSSASDAAITLSSGTHTVFLTHSADRANKLLTLADAFIDHVVSGLLVPTTSGTLAGTLSAGVAYVIGQRVVKGAQSNTYTASKDTYVDLNNVGLLTYAAVTNGAAAPALTANSIRLGKVVTGASTITSGVSTGKDSLGNWMRNTVRVPTCILMAPYNLGTAIADVTAVPVPFGSGTEQFDNDGMHSTVTNNTRVTFTRAGSYTASGLVQYANGAGGMATNGGVCYAQIAKNGTLVEGTSSSAPFRVNDFPASNTQWADAQIVAGDYIQLQGFQSTDTGGTAQTIVRGALRVWRTG